MLQTLNRDRIISEITGAELSEANKKIDIFFENIFNGLESFEDRENYPVSIFYGKYEGGKLNIYIEKHKILKTFFCSNKIWDFLYKEIGLNVEEARLVLSDKVGKENNSYEMHEFDFNQAKSSEELSFTLIEVSAIVYNCI